MADILVTYEFPNVESKRTAGEKISAELGSGSWDGDGDKKIYILSACGNVNRAVEILMLCGGKPK